MRDPQQDPEPGDLIRSSDLIGDMDIEVLSVTEASSTGRWWVLYRVRRDGHDWLPATPMTLADWRAAAPKTPAARFIEAARLTDLVKKARRGWKAPQGDQRGA